MNRVSKPIDKVRDTDWPAECWVCDLVLANGEEARRHREQTECKDTGGHEQVFVMAKDEDLELDALRKAVSEWESAKCMTCSAWFATQQEAREHDSGSHMVAHRYSPKVVN